MSLLKPLGALGVESTTEVMIACWEEGQWSQEGN